MPRDRSFLCECDRCSVGSTAANLSGDFVWVPAKMALRGLASAGARGWPATVGATASISAAGRVLCIGPAEWLAIGRECAPSAAHGASLTVVELTEAFRHIELRGEAVEELLMSVCGIDVHVAAFAPDTCARTRLSGIAVVLDRHSAKKFDCCVPRSCLTYVLGVLRESARGLTDGRFR